MVAMVRLTIAIALVGDGGDQDLERCRARSIKAVATITQDVSDSARIGISATAAQPDPHPPHH